MDVGYRSFSPSPRLPPPLEASTYAKATADRMADKSADRLGYFGITRENTEGVADFFRKLRKISMGWTGRGAGKIPKIQVNSAFAKAMADKQG